MNGKEWQPEAGHTHKEVQGYLKVRIRILNQGFHWQPEKLLKNWCNVFSSGSRVLLELDFMKGYVGETKKKRVATNDPGGAKAMNEDGTNKGGKERTKLLNLM